MTEFKVGDKVTTNDNYTAQTVYTIKALDEIDEEGDQAAWVTNSDHPRFGIVVNLKFMVKYSPPGFFQWRGWNGDNLHGDIKWYDHDMSQERENYVRVNVTPVEEEDGV